MYFRSGPKVGGQGIKSRYGHFLMDCILAESTVGRIAAKLAHNLFVRPNLGQGPVDVYANQL